MTSAAAPIGLRTAVRMAVRLAVPVPLLASWTPGAAQETVSRVPPVPGLTVLSTLHSPDGDRENVVELVSVDASGVAYAWRMLEIRTRGDTIMETFQRHVRANDLAGAPRLDPVFRTGENERPGYTAVTISSAVYAQLRTHGTAPYSITALESAGGLFDAVTSAAGGGAMQQRTRYKGTLTRVSSNPEPFPLLVDGRRVLVPALRLKGAFASGLRRQQYEFWVLADSAHPLVLKSVAAGRVFQVVRINFPVEVPAPDDAQQGATGDGAAGPPGESGVAAALERELDTVCRIELPGVYFAFNSATIDPASDRSLAAVARILARHPDWRMTVEGHTDSVGTDRANQTLSARRAEAVRARLSERHGVDTRQWDAVGYGRSRPREPNATIEGRARNRRVELLRTCGEGR